MTDQALPLLRDKRYLPGAMTRMLLLLALLLLAGCSAFNETRLESSLGRDVDLIDFANEIADDLVSQAFPPLLPRQPELPVLTTTFVDNNELEKTSHFGRLLQEHLAARLVQLGYTVKEIKLRPDLVIQPRSGETVLSRQLALLKETQPAQAILVGTTSMAQRTLYINARLINPHDATIIAARSYRLFMDKNVLAMFGMKTAEGGDDFIKKPREPLINRIFY
jgi:TolB-like protein